MFIKKLNKISAIFVIALLAITACDQPTNTQKDKKKTRDNSKIQQLIEQQGQPIDGQFIVITDDSQKQGKEVAKKRAAKINTLMKKHGLNKDVVKHRYTHAIGGFSAQLSNKQLSDLRNDKAVDHVEQDKVVMLSPPQTKKYDPWWCYYYGIYCDDDGGGSSQETPYGIDRVGGSVDGSGLRAWVVDTGVDLDHDDLNVNTQLSETFVSGTYSADDGNGHGTHVAGTIAAKDNDIDVVGVAAGAEIVAVRVLGSDGKGSNSGVISGIDYVANNAAAGDVANMSLGGGVSSAIDNAVSNAANKGIYFAVAAGNDSQNANNSSPARVNNQNVWTISAIDSNDSFASFSNYGNPPVDYAAPGVDVKSLWKNNGTNTISGTSMATPHAAGVLLVTGSNVTTNGYASGDPDGDADPIIHE